MKRYIIVDEKEHETQLIKAGLNDLATILVSEKKPQYR